MVKSFTIYEEYYDLITLLSEEEQSHVLLAIARYMFEDKDTELNERETKVFVNLKRPLTKSKEQSERRTKKKPEENRKETREKPKGKPRENTSNDVNVNVDVYKEIIDCLNNKTNSKYKHTSKKTQDLIKARMNEGFTIDDFKKVIDKKTLEWLEDTKMNIYLRPETLFGTKFEGYLNQPENKEHLPDWFNKDIEKQEDKEVSRELEEMLKEFK